MNQDEQRLYLIEHGWRRHDKDYKFECGPGFAVELWEPPSGLSTGGHHLTLLAAVRQQQRAKQSAVKELS